MPSSGVQTCADRKSTRLNSSHTIISYAVFCLKKKKDVRSLCRYRTTVPRRPCAQDDPSTHQEFANQRVTEVRARVSVMDEVVCVFFFKGSAAPGHHPSFPPRPSPV